MSGISRRGALASIITATAIAPTIATAHAGIGNLWEQRQAAIRGYAAALADHNAALAAIPAWARPGPKYVINTGEFSGEAVRAPLDSNIKPPEQEGRFRVCRVSFDDVRERFKSNVGIFPKRRAIYHANMRDHFRKLIPLYRAQAAEYRRAGIADLDQKMGVAFDLQWEIEQAIRACPASPERTAACILMEIVLHAHTDDTIETDGSMAVGALALDALQPNLTGLLAEHVAAFLYDDQVPLSQRSFFGA